MLRSRDIHKLFALLNEELKRSGTRGELYVVGGAVMCLAYSARPSTQDVDAWFRPSPTIREAAARVSKRAKVPPDWLNDSVKAYLSEMGDFAPFLELDHLSVFIAQPKYLLAMKCLAMRIGTEFHDEDDIRFLLRLLDLRSREQVLGIIGQYYPLERVPQKTLYALEDLLPGN